MKIITLCLLINLASMPPVLAQDDVVPGQPFLAVVTLSPIHKLRLTHYQEDQKSFGIVGLWPTLQLAPRANVIGSGFDDIISNLPQGSRSSGGGGNDRITAGVLGVALGEADDDSLAGIGPQSSLSGGVGRDVFDLDDRRLIMDLEASDLLQMGGRRILGGVPWEIDDSILIP